MTDTILVINAGSSSIKFQTFGVEETLPLLAKGAISGLGDKAVFTTQQADTDEKTSEDLAEGFTFDDALRKILAWIDGHARGWVIAAAGHRVVHGGTEFIAPVILDDAILTKLENLSPLAPLHQRHNLAPVGIIGGVKPGVIQVACFDTAFHAHHAPVFTAFALPEDLRRQGLRRYGFHGLSYEWLARTLRESAPDFISGRIVAAHLGNGASLCALQDGVSIDTTMSMTALDGAPMGTRCGSLDPGAIIYLARELALPIGEIEKILYNESGLKGLSGISGNAKILAENDSPAARFALDYFALKVAQQAAAMAVSMGGIDGFVFSGGIGENAESIRGAIVRHLAFLPPFPVKIVPANEERMIALHVLALI